MSKRLLLISSFLLICFFSNAQAIIAPDIDNLSAIHDSVLLVLKDPSIGIDGLKPPQKRILLVAGTNIALCAGSFIALNKAWYANYPRSSFHLFNDNKEWNQMDKAGHIWTTFHISRVSAQMWQWTGLSNRKSVILGSITSLAYQSVIEIQDGFSDKWGFSPGDMGANIVGTAAFVSQELGWKEQRILFKLGYSPYNYSDDLIARRNQVFGKSRHERILKDYNSQTYWVSGNIKSFFPQSNLPNWLNMSLGYSSDGLFGGTENKWQDKLGVPYNRSDISRIRRFYLAPDADLTKIKTKNKLLKTVFFVVNMVKIPAPALELNSKGKMQMHFVFF